MFIQIVLTTFRTAVTVQTSGWIKAKTVTVEPYLICNLYRRGE
jgi:hypothetical protein